MEGRVEGNDAGSEVHLKETTSREDVSRTIFERVRSDFEEPMANSLN